MIECFCSECQRHLLAFQLLVQFSELLFQDEGSHLLVHVVEDHGSRQAVEKFGLEGPLHLFHHGIAPADMTAESDALRGKLRPGIGGHDKYYVAEVGLASFVVRKAGVVHHLQQDVVDVLMCFLYLVEQQDAVGRLADGIGEQASILIAYIACWRAYEFGYGMLLGIFAHVETDELDA